MKKQAALEIFSQTLNYRSICCTHCRQKAEQGSEKQCRAGCCHYGYAPREIQIQISNAISPVIENEL